ncbi:EAL domain-containing protein [Acinetobacter sp. S40]|uniref:EAL domain-containing protein n=1 Tax=Acinetobacter sp. S40 TaxID=2767434 RepID=UPI00190D96E9|nr:EAL domain-containing protein [Acinetobacter sp. S40]MBJ9984896.1 EAL domain-containing protein [Acinetobacter sp. S40]
MGSFKVRNSLLSKKLKLSKTRLLIIDDNQLRYNQIIELFESKNHQVQATLLDDLNTFEKQLNIGWDIVIFGRAYDLKIEQVLSLIQASSQPNLPVLLLTPDQYASNEYLSYIQKGVYEIIDLNLPEQVYIAIVRALSYSRLQQNEQRLLEELDTAHSHVQSKIKESNKAVATLQEGIHTKANSEYLAIFGLKSENELIGLPILDILQPTDLNHFKQKFKRVSQGIFDQSSLDIVSRNPAITVSNPLKIEFLPCDDEEDAVQLTIECEENNISTAPQTSIPSQSIESDKLSPTINAFNAINRQLNKQPADANALVVITLSSCPDDAFKYTLETIKTYFSSIYGFIKEQVNVSVFKINPVLYVALFQAESDQVLKSQLISLKSLEKPQLLSVGSSTLALHLHLGYLVLNQPNIKDEKSFDHLLEQAFAQRLPNMEQSLSQRDLGQVTGLKELSISTENIPKVQQSILQALQQKLDASDIHLKYQQLYDKQDSDLYTYEVTSGFIYDNSWQDINQLPDLRDDPELSIKVDRWILVEACKQLHNFLTQYPTARLIINLNRHILLNDKQLPELMSKLLTIVGSRAKAPLTLQFSEESISQNLPLAQQQFAKLKQNEVEISVRDFGMSMYSESILSQIDLDSLSLHHNLCKMLSSDKDLPQLQQKLENFHHIKPVEILARDLNDMTMFANAWNIEARYLQGNYFQKKLDRLTDVQDQ